MPVFANLSNDTPSWVNNIYLIEVLPVEVLPGDPVVHNYNAVNIYFIGGMVKKVQLNSQEIAILTTQISKKVFGRSVAEDARIRSSVAWYIPLEYYGTTPDQVWTKISRAAVVILPKPESATPPPRHLVQ